MHLCLMKAEEERVEYLRYGFADRGEPLVFVREFSGLYDAYMEISEEFRLFHKLYHDRKTDKYIKIDEAGNEDLVAIVEANRVQIRLKEIRQFLAIKEMYLSIQFDCREHSKYSLEELGLKKGGGDHRDDLVCWGHHYGDFGVSGSYQALVGYWESGLLSLCQNPKVVYGICRGTKRKAGGIYH